MAMIRCPECGGLSVEWDARAGAFSCTGGQMGCTMYKSVPEHGEYTKDGVRSLIARGKDEEVECVLKRLYHTYKLVEPVPYILPCGHSSKFLIQPEPTPDFEGDGPGEVHTISGAFCSECRKIAELEKKVRLAIGFKSCESCESKIVWVRKGMFAKDCPCLGCGDMEHWTAKGGG